MPGEALRAAEGLHGSLVGLVLHDVAQVLDGGAVESAHEGVGDFRHPFVPVFVHEVVHHAAGGLGQVGIDVGGVARVLDVADDYHVLLVGREQEAADAAFVRRGLHAVGAVGLHGPHLHLAVGVRIEKCYASVGHPHGAGLALGGAGDAHGLCVA